MPAWLPAWLIAWLIAWIPALTAALIALLIAAPLRADPAQFISRQTLTHPRDYFGGLSGIELDATGTDMTLLADNGTIFTGRITRQNDRITDIAFARIYGLLDLHGGRVAFPFSDTEGLAIDTAGRLYVSFERVPRVARYDRADAIPEILADAPMFRDLIRNSGLESLAIDTAGRLYTMPERSGGRHRPFPLMRLENDTWHQIAAIPRRGRFLSVGADIGPDGLFYLLERDFTGTGFRTRVRRFDVTGPNIPDDLGEQIVLQSRNGQFDNLEGIATWRDTTGAIRLTMIADDNFRWPQKTEIVEYAIPAGDGPLAKPATTH